MKNTNELVQIQKKSLENKSIGKNMVAQFKGKTAGLYPVATDNWLISVRPRMPLPQHSKTKRKKEIPMQNVSVEMQKQMIKNRISKLENNSEANGNIVRKLKRKLRSL